MKAKCWQRERSLDTGLSRQMQKASSNAKELKKISK